MVTAGCGEKWVHGGCDTTKAGLVRYRGSMEKERIRLSTEADVEAIMSMLDYSRTLMRASGNVTQWRGYPTRRGILADIAAGVSYMIGEEGTFALVPGEEPTYGVIAHGRWIDSRRPYCTLHRLAKATGATGVAEAAFAYAKGHCDHLRVDTHRDNGAMLHLIEREGFVECGEVYMADGSGRQAFEWWRWDEVRESLRSFVEGEILPQYDRFDSAHGRDHARRVIARAMVLYRHLREGEGSSASMAGVRPEMVYAAAAMHDLGLSEGREGHHLTSGRIVRRCPALGRWFDGKEVEMIAEAAVDHRASATRAPRSMLGCIVAEADRDVEPETIVRRTVEYGLSHYPELDQEGHWRRTLEHLQEKYGEEGYIKLWLKDSPNEEPLSELRALMADEPRLRVLFERFMTLNPKP